MVKNMSDPVKNAEVEDVLSSIRRLVSEDKRPLQTPKQAPSTDRLVLTPALRVEEAIPAPAPQDAPLQLTEEARHKPAVAEDPLQDLAEDYGDDPYGFDDAEDIDGERDAAAQPSMEMVDDPDGSEDAGDDADLTAKIAALETAIGEISDDWEPDGNSDDDYAGTEPSAMVWEDDLVETPGDELRLEEPSDDLAPRDEAARFETQRIDPPSDPAPEEATPERVIFSRRTEAIREAIAETTDKPSASVEAESASDSVISDELAKVGAVQAEADQTEVNPFWDEPAEVPHRKEIDRPVAEAKAVSEPAPEPASVIKELMEEAAAPVADAADPEEVTFDEDPTPEASDDSDAFDLGPEEQMLDEVMLREMITKIVQSELQGAMGERITRNVRRLVRREIHRALTARDLE